MRIDGCSGELTRLLAEMPFLDRLDMAAVSGRSRGSVYESVRSLEDGGLVSSIPHGSEFTSPARRFYLTAVGLGELAGHRGTTVEKLFRESPTSAQWMRILFERLDCAAVIYRLASAISAVASPIGFRWYRAMPMDAVIKLPDGRTIAVVRQGPTSGRTSFSKRLWRLRGGPQTGAVLTLVPDEIRLRDARRRLSGLPSTAYLALERHVADANPDDAVWRSATVKSNHDLVSILSGIRPGGSFSVEPPLTRSTLPGDLASESPGWDRPDRMMPALLKPAEKRVLDLLSDWPWISQGDLAGLMAVSAAAGVPAARHARRVRSRHPCSLRGSPPRPHRRGAGIAGEEGPNSGWHGPPEVERLSSGRAVPCHVAQCPGLKKPAVAQEPGAHAGGPSFHRSPGRAGPDPRLGGRTARSTSQGVEVLPAFEQASIDPSRRIRRSAQGRRHTALLPGVGAEGGQTGDDGGQDRALPSVLLHPPAHRRSRRASVRAGRPTGRHRGDAFPASGAGRDGQGGSRDPAERLPRGGPAGPGAARTCMAQPRRGIPARS